MGHKAYIVQEGDCISSIAFAHGLFPDTVWKDPKNEALKASRKFPNLLFPGDIVHVPDKAIKTETCAVAKRHRFKRKGVPEILRVQLLDGADKPIAEAAYTIEIDGKPGPARKTDGSGWVNETISPDAKEVTITLTESKLTFQWALGRLAPPDTIEGVQARLNNLGYDCGEVDGVLNQGTRAALQDFQRAQKLPLIEDAAREVGKQTQDALVKEHQS